MSANPEKTLAEELAEYRKFCAESKAQGEKRSRTLRWLLLLQLIAVALSVAAFWVNFR